MFCSCSTSRVRIVLKKNEKLHRDTHPLVSSSGSTLRENILQAEGDEGRGGGGGGPGRESSLAVCLHPPSGFPSPDQT